MFGVFRDFSVITLSLMITMNEELERKLKRERVEICLNCKKFVDCKHIGEFEECVDFVEVEGSLEHCEDLLSLVTFCEGN